MAIYYNDFSYLKEVKTMEDKRITDLLLSEINFVLVKLSEIRNRNADRSIPVGIKDQADYQRYCDSLSHLVSSYKMLTPQYGDDKNS